MKKWIFSLALMFSVSLSNAQIQNMIEHGHSHAPQKFAPTDHEYYPVRAVAKTYLKVKAMEIRGFSTASQQKLNLAFKALEFAVNSDEFRDRVINFKNTQGERSFASNKGMTNEEIYEHFMEGREMLQPDTPGEMNFYLKQYNRWWSRVIGWTTSTTNVININWKFFKHYQPHEVAANLAHEWTHKMGFDHTSAKEHDSAPYAIGYIAGDIASRALKNNLIH